jgi:aspartate aminotransferase-like enzyme
MPLLLIPGPTNVPDRVARALSKQPVPHREKEFESMLLDQCGRMRRLFGTSGEVLLIAGSGTAGMEMAVRSLFGPGDRVLNLVSGKFSERFVEIAGAVGATSIQLEAEWGHRFDVERAEEEIAKGVDGVTIVHNESSTATTNRSEIPRIAAAARKRGAHVIVDAISSLGGMPFEMDAWDVDIAVTGSQKCFMMPPGLAMVAINERAEERIRSRPQTARGYYLDPVAYLDDKGKAPYTPPINFVFGLKEVLDMLDEEKVENVFARHRACADFVRKRGAELALPLFCADSDLGSDTVTGFRVEGWDEGRLRKLVQQKFDLALGGGQDRVKGKILRIGHMGMVNREMVGKAMDAVEWGLAKVRSSG